MVPTILDKTKYKAAFLWMLQSLGKIEGSEKATKLLYFLDFDYYEAYEVSFTGEVYVAGPKGPYPYYFEAIVEEMEAEWLICRDYVQNVSEGERETVTYSPVGTLDYRWTAQESSMLDRIVKKYGVVDGKDLEDLARSQAPCYAVELGEIVPYIYSFYRGTSDLTSNRSEGNVA